ncbi:autotransporter outer membrane beta-barrel domain-containing protein [Veillonella sp.]|uniref:autotransporter family protein n=1 Tax=Veillonella sp. TaxID=1926307 RepID=UPI002904BA8D|nr:autotransporter outer membrane beta-barrel domain-containing protein [Veillonella sp.]MDU2333710.1 autotransporter outer membrane beta-barrel domain-containing protein [Veillonella sp.]MDU2346394.1 autotransporter outer membrane beta-barrel domain-containing protein [Veillonella sp.]
MKLYRHVSAVMAALVLTGLSYSAGATDINVSSDKAEELLGLSMGSPTQMQPEVKHIEDTLTVNVHGKSLTDEGKTKNVTGIYNGFGSQLTVDKDLVVRLKNDAPASKRELGHYYMSAVYAGYGGKVPRLSKDNPDRDFGDTNIHVKGNVDIDAIGSGLQVNQRGHILVDGGGKIITHPVETSDTYSVVAEEGDVYVNTGADGKQPGSKDLVAVGNVGLIDKDYGRDPNHNESPTNIALAFTTPNSSLTGAVLNEYAESNKNPHNSGADIYLQNGATWNNEWIGMERPTPKKERPSGDNAAYLYKGSKVRNLVGGANPTAAGIIHPIDARPITIQNYSGFVNADYKAGVPASEDGKGQIIIQHAADNSHVMVQGDSAKNLTDDASYRTEMQALANKLQYTGNDKKLATAVQINEGITRPAAVAELGTDAFDAQGNLVVGNTATVKHVGESSLVSGTKSALASTAMAWRNNTNDLQRRLGDLRLANTDQGVWAKYIGGKSKITDGADARMTYNGVQLGYDHKVSNGWIFGGALDYSTSSNSYAVGSGDDKIGGIALYGTKQHDDGRYLDIIARGNRLSNNYKLYSVGGQRVNGDYHTFGTSLSAEYGKRIKKQNGFYIDPSVEFIVGRLNGVSYDANIAGGGSMHVKADGVNSAVGRLGFGIGKETEKSNIFAKLALAHEFSGKMNTTYSAPVNPTVKTELDLKDTWLDAEIGGSWNLRPSTYLYGTFTKNFGATIDNTWRIDAGVRHNF